MDAATVLVHLQQAIGGQAGTLRTHAGLAPHDAHERALLRLAGEDARLADELGEALVESGIARRSAAESGTAAERSNHWQRLCDDLQAHRDHLAGARSILPAVEEERPAAAPALAMLIATEERHIRILRDLIARADPQAEN